MKDQLLEGLKLEWDFWLREFNQRKVVSIYFGGGTPYLFGPERIKTVLGWIKKSLPQEKECEITLEANPEDVELATMKEYVDAGINRVSLGVQSFDDQLLQTLSRQHTAQKAIDAVNITRNAGVDNISIDLMYELPGQTLESWKKSCKQASLLPITHLSLYNLTFEPHTVYYKKREQLLKLVPGEVDKLAMYETACSIFEEADLAQYEISAFAREGNYSKHNVGYWTARPFVGFGPSAFSYWKGRRFSNVCHLNRYHRSLMNGQSPIDFQEELPPAAKTRELFVVMLRLASGVNLSEFEQQHGQLDKATQESLKTLQEKGLIDLSPSEARLTRQGILVYDTIASTLI